MYLERVNNDEAVMLHAHGGFLTLHTFLSFSIGIHVGHCSLGAYK